MTMARLDAGIPALTLVIFSVWSAAGAPAAAAAQATQAPPAQQRQETGGPPQDLTQLQAQVAEGQAEEEPAQADAGHGTHPLHEIEDALVRLPLAAALGAVLALRPRRRGTPRRDPAVIQTQIILAVVGAVIMLVVGASLARAFGIVGAANLIRYRSKIEDPKDAVVMLCTLAVGLASGVGLYALAVFSTVFIGGALWIIEGFHQGAKRFDLKIKAGQDTDALRPKLEEILRKYSLKFELRTSSDDEVCYDVQVPLEMRTDRISNAILRLDPEGHASVEWSEKKAKNA